MVETRAVLEKASERLAVAVQALGKAMAESVATTREPDQPFEVPVTLSVLIVAEKPAMESATGEEEEIRVVPVQEE